MFLELASSFSFFGQHLLHNLFLLLLCLSLFVLNGLVNQLLEVGEHIRVVIVVFVCQRLHNVVAENRQAAVLILSLSQIIKLVYQCLRKDCSLGNRVVLGISIQESQCVAIAKFVFINLNLIAKVYQRGILQVS